MPASFLSRSYHHVDEGKKIEDRPKPRIGRSAFAGLRHGKERSLSRANCMPGRVKDSETYRSMILYDYTT